MHTPNENSTIDNAIQRVRSADTSAFEDVVWRFERPSRQLDTPPQASDGDRTQQR